MYTELASKNRSGGLAQLRVKNKSVTIYSVSEAGDRCHVSVLDLYFSKLPKEAIERNVFYLQPVSNVKRCDQPWYTTTPVGKNTLARMVKDICADGGLGGSKSNHSLRATGATELYYHLCCLYYNTCINVFFHAMDKATLHTDKATLHTLIHPLFTPH